MTKKEREQEAAVEARKATTIQKTGHLVVNSARPKDASPRSGAQKLDSFI
jgi:hypothetical protein